MPQLVLKPWFMIFTFSWLIFLIIPAKVMKFNFNNEPETASTSKPETSAWDDLGI
nr:ATP synthase subunit 8 [Hyphessobrycon elachys]